MSRRLQSTALRAMAVLIALICVLGLIPARAQAAGTDTITLERFGYSGVSYESASLGRCQLHQMYYDYGGKTAVGFCGTKGGGMGSGLEGQTWGNPTPITDPTVEMMMAYYYAHSTGTFTDAAVAAGVDTVWDAGYTWYMNAWVQAILWRYQQGSLQDPVEACAEEFMYVYNSLEGTHYTSIDQTQGDSSFRSRTQYIFDLGSEVWGDCSVYLYTFTGAGTSDHPASTVQDVVIGKLAVDTTEEQYTLTVKKVDATNPTKGLEGARFHVESVNGAFSQDIVTGPDGTYTLYNLDANTYAVTETDAPPGGYRIDNAGPEYVVLPNGGSNTVTVTFSDTPEITGSGTIRKVDADDSTRGLAGSVIQITGVDNNFRWQNTTAEGGYLPDIPWETMPIGSFVAEELTPPSGYTLSSDPDKVKQEFYWDGKNEVSLVFENDAKVKIQLLKLDDSGNPLPNAVFNIFKDGQLIASDKTTAAGTITVPNVTEGLFAFVEVSAPSGKAKLQEPVLVYVDQAMVDGGGTIPVTATDADLPQLTILKRDQQNREPIPDTTFEIRGIHFGYHNDVTTGKDGTVTLTLPVDSYEVTEVSVPEPYVVSDAPTQTIWLGPGDEQQLIFENLKKPYLTLSKTEVGTDTPIPGTVFSIEGIDSDFKDEWVTGADGTVSGYVEPGSFEIEESSVPDPYYISQFEEERVKTVSLQPGDETTLYFENQRRPVIEILKLNEITLDPISDVPFRVWYASNHTTTGEYNDLGVYYTDEDGRIVLDDPDLYLRDGWFRVQEQRPAPGYALPEEDTQEVFIPAGGSHTFRFENRPLSAICVWKYDSETGAAIEGAVFQVRYLSGNTSGTGGTVIGTYRTSANGSFTVTNCEPGTYIIEELSSDGSHVIDTPPQTVYLSGEEQEVIRVEFGNSPKGSLLVTKVSTDAAKTPLSDVEFLVTTSDGTVVGNANGKYVTDSSGSFLVENIAPGTTLVVRETKAKPGYLLDDTPQTAQIKAGQTVTLEFRNQPLGNLIIHKLDSVTKEPLAGVQFKITYADGSFLPAEGGKLSSNGLYWTNSEGQIVLSNVTGTVVATEIQTIPGYTIDPNTQSQTVVVNPDDTQELWFYNTPVGGVELVKVSAADKTERLPDAVFEIRRASDDALVDTVTTGDTGTVFAPLAEGDYYALEQESPSGFRLDPTRHYFSVKDGEVTQEVIANEAISGILVHKISTADGEGIPGVSFILYDRGHNPIDQQTTDDRGYAWFEDLEGGSRYYLRELENEGYIPDTQLRTVYVKAGETTEVTWENTPITGQIQIVKKSADYNPTNGLPAGTLLESAVFEIYDKAGNLVDTIKSDSRGLAVSKQLPLSRYTIREVKAPANYGINEEVLTAYLEYEGQILRFEVTDQSLSTGVSITKTGPKEVVSGQPVNYTFSGIANTSNVRLDSFYWRDTLPAQVRLGTVVTGTYNFPGTYKITYRVNGGEYRTLADNLSTAQNYTLAASPAALGLAANERVTEIMFVFGQAPGGFAQVEKPMLKCTAISGLNAGSSFVNVADVGGVYNGQWVQAISRWVTTVYGKTTPLPRTGY
ncbi:SpaA isopeptide-forming pilin-related protein [uncultured Oscillibacter sp.]|uniref:SpaA isopeptide-forming pilin-related protein n=1 Tax=uncultured Oscillibacter sp. TaxID=876091 RepID=UPI002803CF67|nr:SpaA isopeptide-forming pilin-related protein [uncultured Oscillibacter sp.]